MKRPPRPGPRLATSSSMEPGPLALNSVEMGAAGRATGLRRGRGRRASRRRTRPSQSRWLRLLLSPGDFRLVVPRAIQLRVCAGAAVQKPEARKHNRYYVVKCRKYWHLMNSHSEQSPSVGPAVASETFHLFLKLRFFSGSAMQKGHFAPICAHSLKSLGAFCSDLTT